MQINISGKINGHNSMMLRFDRLGEEAQGRGDFDVFMTVLSRYGFRVPCFLTAAPLLLLLLFWCQPVFSQATDGSISGTVTDPSSAVVVGAKVSAINLDTTVQQTTTTNGQGFYAHLNVLVGRYELEVEQTGFQPFDRSAERFRLRSTV